LSREQVDHVDAANGLLQCGGKLRHHDTVKPAPCTIAGEQHPVGVDADCRTGFVPCQQLQCGCGRFIERRVMCLIAQARETAVEQRCIAKRIGRLDLIEPGPKQLPPRARKSPLDIADVTLRYAEARRQLDLAQASLPSDFTQQSSQVRGYFCGLRHCDWVDQSCFSTSGRE
jgi:hypothetical protein